MLIIYKYLVLSLLEYVCVMLNPYTASDKDTLNIFMIYKPCYQLI